MCLKLTFQKARFFSAGGRLATEGKRARHIELSYHMEVRTLNARRMFREQQSHHSSTAKEKGRGGE